MQPASADRYAIALIAGIASLLMGCAAAPPQFAASAIDRRAGDASGCWVNAYGKTQYRPPLATYTGPTQEPQSMPSARSLVVGPNARLEGYGESSYRDESLTLPPGARVADLDAIDFHRTVKAFRIACVSQAARGQAF